MLTAVRDLGVSMLKSAATPWIAGRMKRAAVTMSVANISQVYFVWKGREEKERRTRKAWGREEEEVEEIKKKLGAVTEM